MSNRRRRRGENFYNGLTAVPASVDTGYEVYRNNARLFLPAGVNLWTNPMPLVDTDADGLADGLSVGSSDIHGTVTYSIAASGGQNMAYTAVAGDAGNSIAIVNSNYPATLASLGLVAGDKVTISVVYKNVAWTTANQPMMGIQGWTAVYGTAGEAWTPIPAGDSRVTATFTVQATTVYLGLFIFNLANINAGNMLSCQMGQLQFEKSPFPTPYFDGDTDDSLNANTYAWTGAANASTSTRAVSTLTIPIDDYAPLGTIAARVMPITTLDRTLLVLNPSEAAIPGFAPNTAYCYVAAGGSYAASGPTISMTSPNSHISRWSDAANLVSIMSNGIAGSGASAFANAATNELAFIRFGVPACAWVGPVILSHQYKSDAWTAAMDAELRGACDLTKIKRDFMAPGDALFTGLQVDGSNLYVKGT